MTVQFSGMAHIVRPKHTIERYIGQEIGFARRNDRNKEVREWRQEFPFDNRQDEVVLLYDKDLKNAGDTSNWRFADAYDYARSLIKNPFEVGNPTMNGGPVEYGYTKTGGRAAIYKHQ